MIITVWMICFVRLIARLHYSFQSHVFHAVHLAGRYASQTHFIKNNTCHQRNTRRHLSCLSHYVTQLQQSKNEWYCTLPINPTWETMQNYPATSRQKLIMSSNTFAWKQPRHDQSCIFATSLAFGCCIVFAQTRDVIKSRSCFVGWEKVEVINFSLPAWIIFAYDTWTISTRFMTSCQWE